jgi:mersacidin/lichenicidin family type 2 lantibiotic
MSHEDIIRAWKDEDYRMSLSEEERAQLPEHPAGLLELTDGEMGLIGGGYGADSVDICETRDTCTPECETHIYYETCGISCSDYTNDCSD